MADDNTTRLGDALLLSQQTYQDAQAKHAAEQTELSRRVLDKARRQLEQLERFLGR